MKGIKSIFIAAEIASIICLAMFILHLCEQGTIEALEGVFTFMLAMMVVVFQKEQQPIEWDEEEDSAILISAEDVEL